MNGASRGFSLLETAVAVALAALACVFTLRLVSSALHWGAIAQQRNADAASAGELVDRWRIEEDSAWAIFTPPSDVRGSSNADGHELDFFTRDGKNRSYFWSYTYDAASQTLTRYLYASPGAAPLKDETYAGVTAFTARTYPVTALQDSSTPVYSALYANATLQPGAVRFYPAIAPWIAGGNQITYVRIETASQLREMQLSTQTAPSGFTIVLSYTPAPAAATGPLVTLGKIIFEPGSLAYDAPAQRLARGLNALLGGAAADAQSAGCSYAQLYLQDGTLDTNGKDGFNATDGNGCVTDGTVRLWASEANYPAGNTFDALNPPSNGCRGYIALSGYSWYPSQFLTLTPLAGTVGCTIDVASQDRNQTNGGSAAVSAVVFAPPCIRRVTCYADVVRTQEVHAMKCSGGGAQGPPCPFGGVWLWRDTYGENQFSSIDGGNTWTDLGVGYSCFVGPVWTNNGPASGTKCTAAQRAPSFAYTGVLDSYQDLRTSSTGGSNKWLPSKPPTVP